jgi:hypothetical protein
MNPPIWYGAVVSAAMLLAAAGAVKAIRPSRTAKALSALGLPESATMVRLGAIAEVAVGLSALAGSWLGMTLMAASYLFFSAFVVVALRSSTPISTCGCFGEADTPPTLAHIGVTLSAATVSFTAAIVRHPSLLDVVKHQPAWGLPLLVLSATLAFVSYVLMAVAPLARATIAPKP